MFSVGDSTSESSIADQVSFFFENNEDNDKNFGMKNPSGVLDPLASLSLKSIEVIADNFPHHPILLDNHISSNSTVLSPKVIQMIVSSLSSGGKGKSNDSPIPSLAINHPEIAIFYINHEGFWKQLCARQFGSLSGCSIGEAGLSWKRFWLERRLQTLLESFEYPKKSVDEGEGNDKIEQEKSKIEEEFLKLISFFKDYIYTFRFRQLPSHVSLNTVMHLLPNITKVDIQYGTANFSMDSKKYEVSGMKVHDAHSLEKAMYGMQCLTSLILQSNQIDDEIIKALFINAPPDSDDNSAMNSLVHLDLSHNKISTNGFRILAKEVLSEESSLKSLNVSDNRIHAEGGRCLGRLLRSNISLEDLDISLNQLEDVGGHMLIDGLQGNKSLRSLNLSSNCIGSQSASSLVRVLENRIGDDSSPTQHNKHTTKKHCDSVIENLDLSSNQLTKFDLELLIPVIEKNKTLTSIDLRMNTFSSSSTGNLNSEKDSEINDKLTRIEAICRLNEKRLYSQV